MPVTKAEVMLEERRTDLGRAIVANEEFCEVLSNMRKQVKVWDAMGTGEKMDKMLGQHGVDLDKIINNIEDRRLEDQGWKRNSAGHWKMPSEQE